MAGGRRGTEGWRGADPTSQGWGASTRPLGVRPSAEGSSKLAREKWTSQDWDQNMDFSRLGMCAQSWPFWFGTLRVGLWPPLKVGAEKSVPGSRGLCLVLLAFASDELVAEGQPFVGYLRARGHQVDVRDASNGRDLIVDGKTWASTKRRRCCADCRSSTGSANAKGPKQAEPWRAMVGTPWRAAPASAASDARHGHAAGATASSSPGERSHHCMPILLRGVHDGAVRAREALSLNLPPPRTFHVWQVLRDLRQPAAAAAAQCPWRRRHCRRMAKVRGRAARVMYDHTRMAAWFAHSSRLHIPCMAGATRPPTASSSAAMPTWRRRPQ